MGKEKAPVASLSQPKDKPVTPQDWADYLSDRLDLQTREANKWNSYYEGDHSIRFSQKKYRKAFGDLIANFSDNFMSLIIDSVAERLRIDGFRMTDNPEADADAWMIWQRNEMDSISGTAMIEAMISARAFATVWGNDNGEPIISVDDATEVAVWYDRSVSQRIPAVALKRWTDEWGTTHARLWTPEQHFRMTKGTGYAQSWTNFEAEPNPLGVVPVVELANRPRLRFDPTSELQIVAPIQDAINKVVRDALLASEFAAYPQRWVTGLEIEEDDDGQPKPPPFDSALDRLFQAEDPNVKFGQFQAADLSNYVTLVGTLVQHLASVSRVPFHYFLINGGQAPSGEAINSAEAGLVAKVRDRQTHFGEGWERVMRLAFRVLDDERANADAAETMWRDPEYRTEGQHVDALLKLRSLGVPLQQLWADAGYSPQQIERFEQQRADEARMLASADAAAFMQTDATLIDTEGGLNDNEDDRTTV